jgi:uncharacterized protein
MTTPAPIEGPLSESELDQLDQFLISIGPTAMDLEELDGFLSALIVGPELVKLSEYWPEVIGEVEFEFKTQEEAAQMLGLILRHWNTISSTLDAEEIYEPVLIQDDAGVATGQGWATGFMHGVRLRFEAWESFIDNDETAGLILPIIMLAHEDDPDSNLRTPTLAPDKRENVLVSIAASLPQMFKHFQAKRQQPTEPYRRSEPKTGRNDPCSCGSGKKFKNCCGANPMQH